MIITCASEKYAKTIIWIVKRARDEHRQDINYKESLGRRLENMVQVMKNIQKNLIKYIINNFHKRQDSVYYLVLLK